MRICIDNLPLLSKYNNYKPKGMHRSNDETIIEWIFHSWLVIPMTILTIDSPSTISVNYPIRLG
ncbi:MAG TPA: hypothetical protein VFV86_11930 [Nitrososphaeraceae archaeon]|nr:hypothetical protein [Nitrososphaeraceae archaeon]